MFFITTTILTTIKSYHCAGRRPGSIPGLGRSPREGIGYPFQYSWASLVSQIQSLGWEDSLEKGTATHSSILAWRIP